MTKKQTVGCFVMFLTLMYLPLQFYQGWLLYNHIHATELMWLLWWIAIPVATFFAVVGQIVKVFFEEEK